jgi:hypothetical protein
VLAILYEEPDSGNKQLGSDVTNVNIDIAISTSDAQNMEEETALGGKVAGLPTMICN